MDRNISVVDVRNSLQVQSLETTREYGKMKAILASSGRQISRCSPPFLPSLQLTCLSSSLLIRPLPQVHVVHVKSRKLTNPHAPRHGRTALRRRCVPITDLFPRRRRKSLPAPDAEPSNSCVHEGLPSMRSAAPTFEQSSFQEEEEEEEKEEEKA